jgi:hypothetical protein
MTKVERHKQDLIPLLDAFAESGDGEGLARYIVANSNLPGRRGNIEMAAAFGDAIGERPLEEHQRLWETCVRLTQVSATEAPVNSPEEMLPFCGAIGLGVLGALAPEYASPALETLRSLARDPRWRMREGVCQALQRLLARRSEETLVALGQWVADGDPLEMRAAAATVAHPALLEDGEVAAAALQLHRDITSQVLRIEARRAEEFRVLRKGLGYTVSVVVQAVPQEGIAFMAEMLETQDPDLRWIVRENLKKKRLAKKYPAEVYALKASMG